MIPSCTATRRLRSYAVAPKARHQNNRWASVGFRSSGSSLRQKTTTRQRHTTLPAALSPQLTASLHALHTNSRWSMLSANICPLIHAACPPQPHLLVHCQVATRPCVIYSATRGAAVVRHDATELHLAHATSLTCLCGNYPSPSPIPCPTQQACVAILHLWLAGRVLRNSEAYMDLHAYEPRNTHGQSGVQIIMAEHAQPCENVMAYTRHTHMRKQPLKRLHQHNLCMSVCSKRCNNACASRPHHNKSLKKHADHCLHLVVHASFNSMCRHASSTRPANMTAT
jgi:hypothetical protein